MRACIFTELLRYEWLSRCVCICVTKYQNDQVTSPVSEETVHVTCISLRPISTKAVSDTDPPPA